MLEGVGVALSAWEVLVGILLWARRSSAPINVCVFLIADFVFSFVFLISVVVVATRITTGPDTVNAAIAILESVCGVVSSAIWFFYLLESVRVKNTFPSWLKSRTERRAALALVLGQYDGNEPRVCPRCGLSNTPGSTRCDCGFVFPTANTTKEPTPPHKEAEPADGLSTTGRQLTNENTDRHQGDIVSQLERLADLKARGLLSDAEYSSAKERILNDS